MHQLTFYRHRASSVSTLCTMFSFEGLAFDHENQFISSFNIGRVRAQRGTWNVSDIFAQFWVRLTRQDPLYVLLCSTVYNDMYISWEGKEIHLVCPSWLISHHLSQGSGSRFCVILKSLWSSYLSRQLVNLLKAAPSAWSIRITWWEAWATKPVASFWNYLNSRNRLKFSSHLDTHCLFLA